MTLSSAKEVLDFNYTDFIRELALFQGTFRAITEAPTAMQ
jgi:hypothetical protein